MLMRRSLKLWSFTSSSRVWQHTMDKCHFLHNTAQCNPCPFKMSFNQNCWTTKNSYANEFDHLHKKCYFPGAGDRRRIDRNSIFCISAADPGPAAAGLGWPPPLDTRHEAAPSSEYERISFSSTLHFVFFHSRCPQLVINIWRGKREVFSVLYNVQNCDVFPKKLVPI